MGKVARVDRRADTGFARILVAPSVKLDGVRHLLVLEPVGRQLPAPPADAAANKPDKPEKAEKAGKSKGPKP